jgi:hypothetical protein
MTAEERAWGCLQDYCRDSCGPEYRKVCGCKQRIIVALHAAENDALERAWDVLDDLRISYRNARDGDGQRAIEHAIEVIGKLKHPET